MGELKSLRIERKLTQNQAADILGVSLRSYKSYENDEKKADSIKYKYIIEKISEINPIDKENAQMYLINIMLISVICLAHTQKERQNQPAMLIF